MIGFINIIKCLVDDYEVNNAHDIEQLILLKREHNLQFSNMGEPPTKFVYFDANKKEYNAIWLYLRESDMIQQYVDSVKASNQTKFPSQFIESKYGPEADLDVKIRPINIPDTLVQKMRATLELSYIRMWDPDKYRGIDVSTKTKLKKWITESKVDSIWTAIPEEPIVYDGIEYNFNAENKAEVFESWLIATRGTALNVEYLTSASWAPVTYSANQEQISSETPPVLSLYEDDLKAVIETSKTAEFSPEFFTAITKAGATVDHNQF